MHGGGASRGPTHQTVASSSTAPSATEHHNAAHDLYVQGGAGRGGPSTENRVRVLPAKDQRPLAKNGNVSFLSVFLSFLFCAACRGSVRVRPGARTPRSPASCRRPSALRMQRSGRARARSYRAHMRKGCGRCAAKADGLAVRTGAEQRAGAAAASAKAEGEGGGAGCARMQTPS